MIGPFEEDAQLYLKCESAGGKPAASVTWWNNTINMGGQSVLGQGHEGHGGHAECYGVTVDRLNGLVGQCSHGKSNVWAVTFAILRYNSGGRKRHDAISSGLRSLGFT